MRSEVLVQVPKFPFKIDIVHLFYFIGLIISFNTWPQTTSTHLPITEDGGMISIEGEHYVSVGSTEKHSWPPATDSTGSSGDGIMINSPDIGANTDFGDGSALNYEIVFLQAGIYFVWIRGYGIGSGDTCHVGLNGQEISTGNTIDFPRGKWTCVNENRNEQIITFSIEESGLYIFNIFM